MTTVITVPPSLDDHTLEQLLEQLAPVAIDQKVLVDARHTRWASPYGLTALLTLAQASALLDGRSYVVPDDVKSLAPAVLRHRVQVAPELELEGVTPDAAVQSLFERVDAPRA